MLNKYEINSIAGVELGEYEGKTEIEAICNMHKIAGYRVSYDETHDIIIYPDIETMKLCDRPDCLIIDKIN